MPGTARTWHGRLQEYRGMKYDQLNGGSYILNRNSAHSSTKKAQNSNKSLVICTACALCAAFVMVMLAGIASGATIIVEDSGGADYTSIQAAVNNASTGDTILVYSGTYYENVIIDKQLILTGIANGGGKPIVDANGSGSAITLFVDRITVEGFTVINSSSEGIKVISDYNKLINNNITLNYIGIYLNSSNNNNITDNNVSENHLCGILFNYSSYNNISNNIVMGNNGSGIVLNSLSISNTLFKNTANSNNRSGILLLEGSGYNFVLNNSANFNNETGIAVLFDSNNNNIKENNVSNNYQGVVIYYSSEGNNVSENIANFNKDRGFFIGYSSYVNLTDNIANSNNDRGLQLYISNNSILKNNTANLNLVDGISLYYSNNNVVQKNTAISNNNYGIHFYYSDNNFLINSTANLNKKGIDISHSNDNIIENNTVKLNYDDGIDLDYSRNNLISNNLAESNIEDGIDIYHSASNILINNIAISNNDSGIDLSNSPDSIISNNYLESNKGDGIDISDSNSSSLVNNIAISNNDSGIDLENSQDCKILNNYISDSVNITISVNTVISARSLGIFISNLSESKIDHNIIINNSWGIYLDDNSSNNFVVMNEIYNNTRGLQLNDAFNNVLYLNNIYNNSYGNVYDYGFNQWDNGSDIGNHYSNYDEQIEGCTDFNNNSICDLGYHIPGGSNIDRYPISKSSSTTNATPINFGENKIGYLNSTFEIDKFTFSANSGDLILIKMESSWYDGPEINLMAPNGTLISNVNGQWRDNSELTQLILEDGEYIILVRDYEGDDTGSYKIFLENVNYFNSTLISYGENKTATINFTFELDAYTFSASSEDSVIIRMRSSWSKGPDIHLIATNGTLISQEFGWSYSEISQILSDTGKYTILAGDYEGDDTGNYEIYIQNINNPNSTPIAFGERKNATINSTLEVDPYTFSGSSGDSVLIRSSSFDIDPEIRLIAPNGTLISQKSGWSYSEIAQILTDTGEYTILAGDYAGDDTGDYEICIQNINNLNSTLIAFDERKPATINSTFEIDAYIFSANSGDNVFIRMSSGWDGAPEIRLYAPNGTLISHSYGGIYRSYSEIAQTLTDTGEYTILVGDYEGDDTGNYEICIQNINNLSLTPIAFDERKTATINSTFEIDAYNFSANSGDDVFIRMSSSWDDGPEIRLFAPNRTLISHAYGGGSYSEITQILTDTGEYTILVGDYGGDDIGNYEICIQNINNLNFTLIVFGESKIATINSSFEIDAYTFSASSGDDVFIRMSSSWDDGPEIRLFAPNGTLISHSYGGYGSYSEITQILTDTGEYTILVGDYEGDGTGNYGIYIQNKKNPTNSTLLAFGENITATINSTYEIDSYTFSVNSGDSILIRMSSSWDGGPEICLIAPNGTFISYVYGKYGSYIEIMQTLTDTGEYTILAGDYEGDNTGDYEIYIQRINSPINSTSMAFDETKTANINSTFEIDAYTFSASSGDSVLIRMSSSWYNGPEIRLIAPNGTLISQEFGWSYSEIAQVLTDTGEHTILVGDYEGDDTGDYKIYIQRINNPINSIPIAFGENKSSYINSSIELDAFTFSASSGDSVLIRSSSFYIDPEIRLIAPNGTLISQEFGWSYSEIAQILTDTGEYTILVGDYEGDDAGNYEIYVQRIINRIVNHAPSGLTPSPISFIRFDFSRAMDEASFSLAEDIVSFTGPNGIVIASGYYWSDSHTLEVTFEPQYTPGEYEMVMGPEILDFGGNAMNQDEDQMPGEIPNDRYIATFIIDALRIVNHAPSGLTPSPVYSIKFNFGQAVDEASFSLAEDIVSFTGPNGSLIASGYNWSDSHTLEVTFDPQYTSGEYEMVMGPEILDLGGNAMDQDEDQMPGEIPNDRYIATFKLSNVLYWSEDITEDTIWNCSIVVIDGSIDIASGVTLTIEPETVVKFVDSSSGINVQGTLDIRGTHEHPVIMTSSQDDTAGGDTNKDGTATSPTTGDWKGLTFDSSTAMGLVKNVQIRYADIGVHGTAGGANIELHNSVLRDGNYGIYVYTPYVETELDNCIISNNRLTGVFVRASSSHVLRNCNIVGNGLGIHLGAATLTLENTIVAFNQNGMDHSGSIPSVVVHNSNFYNPAGEEIIWNYNSGKPQLGQNGNMNNDPLFVDYEAGNYELNAFSPCVDSGSGTGVVSEDYLGRSRYDDQGMPNVGTGYPSYVDMGAFERQENTAAGDLAITYLSNPDPGVVTINDMFSVEWTVINHGLLNCTGAWQDKLYLSSDSYISSDDLIFGIRIHNETLSPGDIYTEMLTATVPPTSGPKYILVQTNADRVFPEADETNNIGIAWQILAVDVPLLQLDTPITGTLIQDQWNFYRFEATMENSVQFNLDSEAASGSTGLYLSYSMLPTLNQYDTAGTIYNQPDQEAKLMMPLEGTYYVGIYGQNLPGGVTDYTLSANLTDLGIESVSPNVVGNAGNATMEIVGDNFSYNDQIYLLAPDGVTQLASSEVYYVDLGHVFATFDFTAANTGFYDIVVVTAGSEITTLSDAVEVTQGNGPDFHASLSLPGMARPGRVISVRVDYSNTGTNDLTSPLLTLIGPEDAQWQAPNSNEWITGPEFKLMALSTSGPANILRANQSESIEVKVRVPVTGGSLALSLYSLGARPGDGSEEIIDWAYWYDNETIITEMESTFGTTWEEYVSSLATLAANVAPWEGIVFSAHNLEFYALLNSANIETSASNLKSISSEENTIASSYDEPGTIWVLNLSGWEEPEKGVNVFPGERTAIIIHGHTNTHETLWVGQMAYALRAQNVKNVLAVDWGRWANPTGTILDIGMPTRSARQIPEVAMRVATQLRELGLNEGAGTNMHLIGHSHGAHVAGLTAEYLGTKPARITALDASEELSHIFCPKNFLGSGWGENSARFVDFYKSSVLYGGENMWGWGTDNFLLVKSNEVWGSINPYTNLGNHEYAYEWYIKTINNKDPTLELGYSWHKDSWDNSQYKFENLDAQNGNWKGLIRGAYGKSVIETFSEGTDKAKYPLQWQYPGAWYEYIPADQIIDDLAAAVEMEITNVQAVSEEGGSIWKAGGKGTIYYDILNNADNPSIPENYRQCAQKGQKMGLMGLFGTKGPIKDSVWLSDDDKLEPEIDIRLEPNNPYIHKEDDFLKPKAEKTFKYEIKLPGEKEILKSWNDDKLENPYYIFVDAGSSKFEEFSYTGELYSENNIGFTPITIEGEDLSANAGPDRTLIDYDDNGIETVNLDGSRSTPEESIDKYEWSIGSTKKVVDHEFPVGEHSVTLTVTNNTNSESDTDQVIIIVKPKKDLPDGDNEDNGDIPIFSSWTPEDKFGPAGYDASDTPENNKVRYIDAGQTMDYRIEFWNKEDAPVPTQDAVIEDTLDPNIFDLSTFEFTRIGFLQWDKPLPGGQAIDTRIDTRPEMNIAVEVTATFDPESGNISWWFHCIDPLTGDWPEDPMAGFLPPFNPDTGFEIGWVEFRVKQKADLPSGSQILNQAFVEFDFAGDINDHPAPKEGPWVNTIDAVPPTSTMTAELLEGCTIQLNWTGQDDVNGSGIRDYSIYVSENGGMFSPLINTVNNSTVFVGEYGHTYAFYSIVRDNVGHIEDTPDEPDATISVSGNLGDFSGDGITDAWDITYLARSIIGILGYEILSSGDVSGDGVVDAWDCTYLARAIAGVPGYNL